MKKCLAVKVGYLMISAGLIFAGGPKVPAPEFTLAIPVSATISNSYFYLRSFFSLSLSRGACPSLSNLSSFKEDYTVSWILPIFARYRAARAELDLPI